MVGIQTMWAAGAKEWDQEDCGSLNFKLQRKSEVRDHLKIRRDVNGINMENGRSRSNQTPL